MIIMNRPERRAYQFEINKAPFTALERERFQKVCEVTSGRVYEWRKVSTGQNTKPRVGKCFIKKTDDYGLLAKVGSIRKLQRLIQKAKKIKVMDENGLTSEFKKSVAKRLALNNHVHSLFREYVPIFENKCYDAKWREYTVFKNFHWAGMKLKTEPDPLSVIDSLFCFSHKKNKLEELARAGNRLDDSQIKKWNPETKELEVIADWSHETQEKLNAEVEAKIWRMKRI